MCNAPEWITLKRPRQREVPGKEIKRAPTKSRFFFFPMSTSLHFSVVGFGAQHVASFCQMVDETHAHQQIIFMMTGLITF